MSTNMAFMNQIIIVGSGLVVQEKRPMDQNIQCEFWSPSPIDKWRGFLSSGIRKEKLGSSHYSYISNISYSIQYLEFLNYQLKATALHSTVKSQTIKTFVVVSMSVVEGILFYVLYSNSELPSEEWETIKKELKSSEFIDGERRKRILTTLQEKLEEPKTRTPTLDPMLKRVEKKKLLGIDTDIYKTLNHLRKLRNKVHIQDVTTRLDTDWNTFSEKEFAQSKSVLLSVLTSDQFKTRNDSLLEFLI